MIKKILSLGITLMMTSSLVFASDLTTYCAQPYDMSKTPTKVLTAITGMNFISKAVLIQLLRKN